MATARMRGFRVLFAVVLSSPCFAQQLDSAWLQTRTESLCASGNLIGVGCTVLVDGEIVAAAVSGQRVQNTGVELGLDDRWHIGSVTKSITATMIARLVERQRFNWESTVPELLPDLAESMHPSWKEVTVHHLLTHTAGLPPNFGLKTQFVRPPEGPERQQARREALAEVLLLPPSSTPGSKMVYSNVGYTLAGYIAAVQESTTWEALVAREVFKPLNLRSAGFGPPIGNQPHDQPWGHQRALVMRFERDPQGLADNSPVIGPAGSIHLSMADLARYGWVHLAGESTEGYYLKSSAFRRLHTGFRDDYGYGWIEWEREWAEGRVLWHNGSNTFWYTLLVLLPAHDAVVVCMTNDGDMKTAEELFFALTQEIAPCLQKDGNACGD